MTERIDASGRWILSNEEVCRFCGALAKDMHPAGVVPDLWTCTRCGRKQNDPFCGTGTEIVIDPSPRDDHEARA